MKKCTKCGLEYPATTEYFNKNKRTKDGFTGWCRTCRKKYRKEHQKEIQNYRKKWYKTHKKEELEYNKNYKPNWYQKNKEKIAQQTKKYRQTNAYKIKALVHRRRTLELVAKGFHTAEDIEEIWELQRGRCLYCRISLVNKIAKEIHLDHFIPLTRGGSNCRSNLAFACDKCNHSKRNAFPWNWGGWLGMYPVFWDEIIGT